MMNAREIRWAPWIIFSATVLGAAFCAVRLEAQLALPSARANPTALTQSAPATLGRNKAPFDAASADAAGYQALDAKRIDDAEVRFKAVLGARPQDADALAGMGLVRMQQGNFLGAVSFLEQAKQANPNDKVIAAALDNARFSFLAGEGSAALATNDLGTAEKRYREALELRPGSVDALRGLVATLLAAKRLDEAQELLEKSLTQQAATGAGPAAGIDLLLADVYLERGQPQLAYPVYRQVLHEDRQNADAWAGVLTTLHMTGHDADATAETMRMPAAIRAQLQANPSYAQMMGGAQTTGQPPTGGAVSLNSAQQAQLPTADDSIQNARQLLNSTNDAGLYRELMQLGARADLSDGQRRAVQMIWVEWAVRRARQALAAGEMQHATDLLDAAARSSPDAAAATASAALPSEGRPQQLSTLLNPGSGAVSSVAVSPAAPNASAQSLAQNAANPVSSGTGQSGEAYQPYVTYIAPPPAPIRAPMIQPSNSAATSPSVVGLPTAGQSTKVAAARNASSAQPERAHRPQEQTATPAYTAKPETTPHQPSATQVTQPAAQPARHGGDVPDTGDQQYPQPPKPPKP